MSAACRATPRFARFLPAPVKSGRFSLLSLFPVKWNPNPRFNVCTPCRFWLVGALVSCCLWFPVGARAELTQSEVQAAIEAAFAHGYPSASVLQQIRNFVQAGPPTLNRGVGYYAFALDSTVKRIENLLKESTNSVSGGSVWTTNDVSEIITIADSIWQDLANFNYGFSYSWTDYYNLFIRASFESDPGGDLLRTWDPNTLAVYDMLWEDFFPVLSGMSGSLSNLANATSSGFDTMSDSIAPLATDLTEIKNRLISIDSRDRESVAELNAGETSYTSTRQQNETDYTQGMDEWQSAIDDYDPHPQAPSEPEDYTRVSLTDVPVDIGDAQHGTTILLTSGVSEFAVPRMEASPFESSNFSAFFDSLTTACRAFWTALFILLSTQTVRRAFKAVRAAWLMATAPSVHSAEMLMERMEQTADRGGTEFV